MDVSTKARSLFPLGGLSPAIIIDCFELSAVQFELVLSLCRDELVYGQAGLACEVAG